MKKILYSIILVLVAFTIKASANDSLLEFCNMLEEENVFQQPARPKIFPGLYSVKSFVYSEKLPSLSYSDTPKADLLYFAKWTKIVFRSQYITDEFSSKNIKSIPNVKCFIQKGLNGDVIYNYELDCLLFQSNKDKSIAIWDTGKFIGICILKQNKSLKNVSTIRKQLEEVIVKYANYPMKEIKKFNFDLKKIKSFKVGFFKGKPYCPPNIPGCKIYSWNTFVSYAIGEKFIILMFPERLNVKNMSARIGEVNRF